MFILVPLSKLTGGPHSQVGMLSEMGDFALQSESSAAEWADGRETAFTEELDSNLRAHR